MSDQLLAAVAKARQIVVRWSGVPMEQWEMSHIRLAEMIADALAEGSQFVMVTDHLAPPTPSVCMRAPGHDGPCNGLPRAARWGACYETQTEAAFLARHTTAPSAIGAPATARSAAPESSDVGGGGAPAAGEGEARDIARLKASVPSHLANAIWASARNNAGPVSEREARMAADCVLVAAIKAWPETVDAIAAALRAPAPPTPPRPLER